MKNKIYCILILLMLLLTSHLTVKASGNSPADNGWGKSTGKIVFRQSESNQQGVVIDTEDLQALYNLAK